MPDTTTAAARVIANSRNSEPVSPPWKPIGAYTAASVIVIAMIGPTSSRAPISAASIRGPALAHVPLDVLDHHDRVVHHQPDRQHDGQDGQQVEAEARRRT